MEKNCGCFPGEENKTQKKAHTVLEQQQTDETKINWYYNGN